MRLIMFDMDGTLIDTQALIAENAAAAFRSIGLPPPTPAEVRSIIGLSLPVAIGRLLKSDDVDLIEAVVGQFRGEQLIRQRK